MNKYKLNFLCWITKGECPDSMLENAHDFKIDGDKFSFKTMANVNTKDWRYAQGSSE